MKVSRRSWHYRLYRTWARAWWSLTEAAIPNRYREPPDKSAPDPTPKSLCTYFWSVTLLTLFSLPGLICVLPLLFIGSYIILAVNVLADRIKRRSARKRRERGDTEPPPREKKPSVVLAYVKAKKRGLCPLIELVDD